MLLITYNDGLSHRQQQLNGGETTALLNAFGYTLRKTLCGNNLRTHFTLKLIVPIYAKEFKNEMCWSIKYIIFHMG